MNLTRDINLLLKYARPEILRYYNISSCIISARVAVEVMKRLGYTAYAQPVECCVYNARMVEKLNQIGRFPTKEEFQTWIKEDPKIWSVALGHRGPNEQGFVCHLVAIVNGNVMVDLSLDQATREQYDIKLYPFATTIQQDFLNGSKPFMAQKDGMAMTYTITHETSWKLSNNWTNKRQYQPLVEAVIRKMKVAR